MDRYGPDADEMAEAYFSEKKTTVMRKFHNGRRKKRDRLTYEQAIKTITLILENPKIGKPMCVPLVGIRKFHVGPLVVTYRIDEVLRTGYGCCGYFVEHGHPRLILTPYKISLRAVGWLAHVIAEQERAGVV
jgi:mRNA-degrading endonuclease RelE of RelBE toxin-antitoxin system